MTNPTLKFEKKLWEKGIKYIAGVDEVGRGALVGPVVAAAVILPVNFNPEYEINDSKKLSKTKRELASKSIKRDAICSGIGQASALYIDTHGIVKATQKAFLNAVKKLKIKPEHILIDAFYIDKIDKKLQTPIVHGDNTSVSIAAASIVAKVHRDNLMAKLHKTCLKYCFNKHKGYGTKLHKKAIGKYGLSKHHRKSFRSTS